MTSKEKRFNLYKKIDEWLEYSTLESKQRDAIRSLLQTLKSAENKEKYDLFMKRFQESIDNNN